MHMKHYLMISKLIHFIVFVVLSSFTTMAFAETDMNQIKAVLVKDEVILNLLKQEAIKVAPAGSDIEEKQIIRINNNNGANFIVPVRANVGENRGCYIFSFDQNIRMRQTILLSKLEEVESCEIIKAVFSCNRTDKATSGLGVLYGKRMGSDHYFTEGSYLIINDDGALNEDTKLSERLNDINTVSKAKKKLGCR